MFCPKCGTNVGDNAFCPNCGNAMASFNQPVQQPVVTETPVVQPVVQPVVTETPVSQQIVAETPVVEPTAQPVASEVPVSQPVVNETAQRIAMPSGYAERNANSNVTFSQPTGQPIASPIVDLPEKTPKNKKKALKFVIAAVIVAALGVGIFFAWPHIMGLISPKSKAIAGFKNYTSAIQKNVNDVVDGKQPITGNTAKKTRNEGTIQITKLSANGTDYLAAMPAKNMNYQLEIDPVQMEVCGKLGIGKSAGSYDLEADFFANTSRAYFSLPQMSSKSFYSDIVTNVDGLDDLQAALSMMGMGGSSLSSSTTMDMNAVLQQNAELIKSVTKDFVDATDKFIEDASYEKIQTLKYKGVNDNEMSVTEFEVAITSSMMADYVADLVERLFDNKNLSSYTSILTMAGVSKSSIVSQVRASMPTSTNSLRFNIYVNSKNEIVKYIFDGAKYGSSGIMSVEFTGKSSIYDCVTFIMDANDVYMSLSMNNDGATSSFRLDMQPNSQQNQFISLSVDGMPKSDVIGNSKINVALSGNVDTSSFDIAFEVNNSSTEIAGVSMKASNFSNAIDASNMTTKQEQDFANDITNYLTKNGDKLAGLIPSFLIN